VPTPPVIIRQKRRSEQKGTAGKVAAPQSERAYSCVQNPLIFPGL
jgi:hypothetical protein